MNALILRVCLACAARCSGVGGRGRGLRRRRFGCALVSTAGSLAPEFSKNVSIAAPGSGVIQNFVGNAPPSSTRADRIPIPRWAKLMRPIVSIICSVSKPTRLKIYRRSQVVLVEHEISAAGVGRDRRVPQIFPRRIQEAPFLADGGSCGELSMRLMIAADSPEHLWLPLITVQAVLRDNSSTRACLSSLTKPASTSACRSSRSLADCLAFMFELIDAGLRVGPFCGPAQNACFVHRFPSAAEKPTDQAATVLAMGLCLVRDG